MSVSKGSIADHLTKRDHLENEFCRVTALVETAQAAVTNPEVSPRAISDTLCEVVEHIHSLKNLCLQITPT